MTPTRFQTPFCHSLHVITCQQQGNRLRASENKNINEHEWENWQESKKGIWEREVCSHILPSVVCWEAVHCSTDIKAHASCLSPNPLPWCPSIRFVAYMSTHIHTASPHTSEKLQMCVCVHAEGSQPTDCCILLLLGSKQYANLQPGYLYWSHLTGDTVCVFCAV